MINTTQLSDAGNENNKLVLLQLAQENQIDQGDTFLNLFMSKDEYPTAKKFAFSCDTNSNKFVKIKIPLMKKGTKIIIF